MTERKKNDYWGEANGIDDDGKEHGVSIYRRGTSFRLVDDNLREHLAPSHRKLDRESIRQEIADVLHYRDIEFAFPQNGVEFKKRS